jgi:catechol 2,3-dioxygenase
MPDTTTDGHTGRMTSVQGILPPGYRLPAETKLGRVSLQVSDLERSLAYYQTVLGLNVKERSGNVAVLGAHGDGRPIVELHARAGATPVPRRGRLGLYHFAILLPDRVSLGRFVKHLDGLGVHAGMSDHFVSEAIYLSDPDGLGIEVYSDRPRSLWRYDDRQLFMVTEPLDVANLIRAAGNESWTGAPAGTTLGHVHLYVDDLTAAAKFYHEGLGFDKVVWSYPGALFMSAGGYHHHLGTNTWAAGAQRAGENDAKMLEWEVLLPSSDQAAEAARSLGSAGAKVVASDEGFRAVDPCGTGLRIGSATDV